MLIRLACLLVTIVAFSFTEIPASEAPAQTSDSCWNKIKVSCGGSRNRAFFRKEQAPVITPADYAKMDTLGVITEEQLLADTLSLTIIKYTAWETNAATNSLERKILFIDSVKGKIRWECEYAGPGKGNCTTCQVTDCNGQPMGPLKTGQRNPNK